VPNWHGLHQLCHRVGQGGPQARMGNKGLIAITLAPTATYGPYPTGTPFATTPPYPYVHPKPQQLQGAQNMSQQQDEDTSQPQQQPPRQPPHTPFYTAKDLELVEAQIRYYEWVREPGGKAHERKLRRQYNLAKSTLTDFVSDQTYAPACIEQLRQRRDCIQHEINSRTTP